MWYNDRYPRIQIPKGQFIGVKWAQTIISGRPVSLEQAFEIIRRTDPFVTSPCDNFDYDRRITGGLSKMLQKMLGFEEVHNMEQAYFDANQGKTYWSEGYALRQLIARCLGHIETEYIYNNWGYSCYIGGPNGWISPKGYIHHYKNIGKDASLDEVIMEFEDLTDAFPYLELAVSIYNHEECERGESDENRMTAAFTIKDKVFTFEDNDKIHERWQSGNNELSESADPLEHLKRRLSGDILSQYGLPGEFLERCAELHKPTVDKIVAIAQELNARGGHALNDWLYDCQQDLEKIDMNQAPQHAIIHEKFITEAGIKFPFLKAPEKQNDDQN